MDGIILSNISLPELAAKIADLIGVNPIKSEPAKASPNVRYLSRREAADALHVTLPTLAQWTKTGKIKAHRIGRRVLYRADDLQSALSPIVTKKAVR